MFKNYFGGFIIIFLMTFGMIYFFSYTTMTKRMDLLDNYMALDKNSLTNPKIIKDLEMEIYSLSEEDLMHDGIHLHISDNIFHIDTSVTFKKYDKWIKFNTSKHMQNIFYLYYISVLLVFLIQIKILISKFNENKNKQNIIHLQNAESKLASKNLSLLAENIHHELKTPLIVIVNKLETIREETIIQLEYMSEKVKIYGQDCSKGEAATTRIQRDIDLIETHIDVIYNLLDRMKNFKNIKRTTENKSLYEVIGVAFQTLELFSKNKFKFSIDPRLRSYMVYGNITNEDILNVFINHIKNSLEANTTKLEVALIKYHKNMVYLQLLDNGDGIPKEAIDSIYVPNFSTKEINKVDEETRGIGLYLSRTTLVTDGGDDFLIETSDQGTSFGINIPALRR